MSDPLADCLTELDVRDEIIGTLRSEKADLERQLAVIPVKAEEWKRLYETTKLLLERRDKQLAEAQKNEQRYLWLRPRLLSLDNAYDLAGPVLVFLVPKESRWSMNLDTSIDAAIDRGGEG